MFFLTTLHAFLKTAKEQVNVLENMYKKMTMKFQNTAKYFSFDPKKYTMEELFTDLKTFVHSFNVWIFFCFFLTLTKWLIVVLLQADSIVESYSLQDWDRG